MSAPAASEKRAGLGDQNARAPKPLADRHRIDPRRAAALPAQPPRGSIP